MSEPIIVCREGEEINMTNDELEILASGPKFCILNNLSDEKFEGELEQMIVKYRWELMGQDLEDQKRKNMQDSDKAIEAILDEDELEDCKEHEKMEDGKKRMVFDREKMTVNFGRRRTTDPG